MHFGGLRLVAGGDERVEAVRIQIGHPHLLDHLGQVALVDYQVHAHEWAPVGSKPSKASFSTIAFSVNGLITYSWAPAANARTIWLCSLSVVTMTSVIGRRRGSA